MWLMFLPVRQWPAFYMVFKWHRTCATGETASAFLLEWNLISVSTGVRLCLCFYRCETVSVPTGVTLGLCSFPQVWDNSLCPYRHVIHGHVPTGRKKTSSLCSYRCDFHLFTCCPSPRSERHTSPAALRARASDSEAGSPWTSAHCARGQETPATAKHTTAFHIGKFEPDWHLQQQIRQLLLQPGKCLTLTDTATAKQTTTFTTWKVWL